MGQALAGELALGCGTEAGMEAELMESEAAATVESAELKAKSRAELEGGLAEPRAEQVP